ncbi:alpha/beta fold hydrolase [Deltaproteobacteria bacterium TL4]
MAISLAFREYGLKGPPLIILHGLLGSSSNWATIARQLQADYHLWVLDLRNHGDSAHVETMTYEEMAEDVFAFMDCHELGPSLLLGHSLGGKIAMWCALQDPLRFSRLLVADIAPVAYDHSHLELVHLLKKIDLTAVTKRDDVEQMLTSEIQAKPLRQFLMKNLYVNQGSFRWKVNLDAIEKSVSQLSSFPQSVNQAYLGKTLFIGGVKSDYLTRQHYAEIYRLFPATQIVMLKEAGHWLHVDQAEHFVQTLRAFLRPQGTVQKC